ncbi:MAG: glutaminyl-peptide cyclotransferase, partial [Ferruginibacter sp.]
MLQPYFQMKLFPVLIVSLLFLYSCGNNANSPGNNITVPAPPTPVINYAVTKYFPHDTSLYTEGFLVHNGQLF